MKQCLLTRRWQKDIKSRKFKLIYSSCEFLAAKHSEEFGCHSLKIDYRLLYSQVLMRHMYQWDLILENDMLDTTNTSAHLYAGYWWWYVV